MVNLISRAEFWYNTSFHTSLKYARYKSVYGRDVPPLFRYDQMAYTSSLDLENMSMQRDKLLAELREQLYVA